VHGRV